MIPPPTGGKYRRMAERDRMVLLRAVIAAVVALAFPEPPGAQAEEVPPPGLVVAFMADGPRNDRNAATVYRLVRDYGADAVIHSGDTDYDERQDWFERRIDETLGPMFPYFLSVGNHDDGLVWADYAARFQARCDRIPGATCAGDYGINSVVHYAGLTVVLSGVSTMGLGHEQYAREALSASDSAWKICSWHKRLTGSAVAEVCRQQGALIVNGHEHNYRRTRTLSSISGPVASTEFSDPRFLRLGPGTTFMVWNGLGGSAITSASSCCSGAWAAAYDAMHAVLFITFHVDGNPYAARGELVNVNGEVLDTFVVVTDPGDTRTTTTVAVTTTTTAAPATTTTAPAIATTTTTLPAGSGALQIQVAGSSDDAEESATAQVDTASSDLELVYDGSRQTVGIRFRSVDIPWGADVTQAYVQFVVDEAPTGQTTPTLTIQGQAIGDAPAFATINGNLSERARTSAQVQWQPPPWPTVGVAGVDQRTPDLSAVIEEIVRGDAWAPGNALVVLITGTSGSKANSRTAEAYDGAPADAPVLYVEYRAGDPTQTTTTTSSSSTRPPTTTTTAATVTTTRPPTTSTTTPTSTTTRPPTTSTTVTAPAVTTTTTSTTSATTTTTTTLPLEILDGGFESGTAGWLGWDASDNRGEVVRTSGAPCEGAWSAQMFDSSSLTRSIH